MLRWLWPCLLLGCGDQSKTCRIETFAQNDVAGQQATDAGEGPIDCGDFTLDADAGFTDFAMAGAVYCVNEAIAANRAFRLVYDVWDPYKHLRAGYTGAMHGGTLRVHEYAYVGDTLGGSFDPRPSVTQVTCKTLTVTPSCTVAAGKPCLTCATPTNSTSLCHF
jgi:hypothetical protein